MTPKVKEPTNATEFRPITLCNVLYKLVSKAIMIRLKEFMPFIATENHNAFVHGRLITDNDIITMEVFHSMKHRFRGRKGTVAMNFDMSNSSFMIEWVFSGSFF